MAIWRAIRFRRVTTTVALRRLVTEILASLRDAPAGVSASLRRACGYAGAITLMALRVLSGTPTWRDEAEGEPAYTPPPIPVDEEARAKLRQESVRGLDGYLSELGASSMAEAIRLLVARRGGNG